MQSYVLNRECRDILNEVGRWKIIDQKSLYGFIKTNRAYKSFAQKLYRLEKRGFLQGHKLGQNRKYFSLSSRVKNEIRCVVPEYREDSPFTHDLICSNVLKELIKHEQFIEGTTKVSPEVETLCPDAMVTLKKNQRYYEIAIEVELTQKTKYRVKEKFRKYLENSYVNNVLYITNDSTLLKCYKSIVDSLQSDARKIIILMFDENLDVNCTDLKGAICYRDGKEQSFEEIFGELKNQ